MLVVPSLAQLARQSAELAPMLGHYFCPSVGRRGMVAVAGGSTRTAAGRLAIDVFALPGAVRERGSTMRKPCRQARPATTPRRRGMFGQHRPASAGRGQPGGATDPHSRTASAKEIELVDIVIDDGYPGQVAGAARRQARPRDAHGRTGGWRRRRQNSTA